MIKELNWDGKDNNSDALAALQAALPLWSLLPYANLNSELDKAVASYIGKISGSSHLFYSSSPLWLAGVKKLNWDSNFFEFGIGRIEPLISVSKDALAMDAIAAGDQLIAQCIDRAKELGLQQLSAPVYCSDTLTHLCLERAGFRLVDTIVTYNLSAPPLDTKIDPCVRKAELADLNALAEISGECFANRAYNVNRFNSDTQFPAPKVRELYSLWLENSFKTGLADIVFAYVADGNPVGFITASLPTKEDLSVGLRIGRIPLNAVHPDYQGQGIYTKLAKAAVGWLATQKVEVVEIKTQLPNAGVHRTWSRFGAQNTCSFHTFHLDLSKQTRNIG